MRLFDKTPNITLIDSPPASGKTNLVKYILQDLFKSDKLKYGIVFCPTNFNGSYDFLNKKWVYGVYEESALVNLINLQISQIKECGKAKPAFIIWDDCIGTIDFNSQILKKLFTTYRHYNLQLIFTTQYIYCVPPVLRSCTTYFITFNQQQKRSLQAIYETFMSDKDSYDECKNFIAQHCQNYNFVLINTQKSKESKYKICRVPLMGEFRINY